MRKKTTISFGFSYADLQKIIEHYDTFSFLNSNNKGVNLLFVGLHTELGEINGNTFAALNQFIAHQKDWIVGFLPYDLKNEVEPKLSSQNEDIISSPSTQFYVPKLVVKWEDDKADVFYLNKQDVIDFQNVLATQKEIKTPVSSAVRLNQKVSKETYIEHIKAIKEHIQLGNIYEMNYCHEFYASEVTISPVEVYQKLNEATNAPFSVFYKHQQHYVLSGSPERFLKKEGDKIISQPIKGTAKRGATPQEDEAIKTALENDPKERTENIMIVDLVRNDLSKTAAKGSVEVQELCKVYSFDTVHQMISTVTSTLAPSFTGVEVLKSTFPMGSMTGAPKIAAMEIIEEFEQSKRGIYSGAIGYFTPEGDFDFNVVIRSILYNEAIKKCSFMVGGAITLKSNPEKEYQETLLKANALINALS